MAALYLLALYFDYVKNKTVFGCFCVRRIIICQCFGVFGLNNFAYHFFTPSGLRPCFYGFIIPRRRGVVNNLSITFLIYPHINFDIPITYQFRYITISKRIYPVGYFFSIKAPRLHFSKNKTPAQRFFLSY